MKKPKTHLVNILYQLPNGKNYIFTGIINEVIGDNGKAIVYPNSIFKQVFGFKLPDRSMISIY